MHFLVRINHNTNNTWLCIRYFQSLAGVATPVLLDVAPICCDLRTPFIVVTILTAFSTQRTHTHIYTRLTALSGTTRVSRYRKVKPIWILLKQGTVSGSGITWAICKSAPRSRQITTPEPHHSVFYRPDALPAAQPTASLKALKG